VPTPAEVTLDTYLTGYSLRFAQSAANFIANRVFPVVPVQLQSALYMTFPRGYFWRDQMEPRPLGGRPPRADYKTGQAGYFAIEYGLEHAVDDRTRANVVGPLVLDEQATTILTQASLIKRDRFWASKYFKTGVWAFDYEGVAAAPTAGQFLQFNQAGSDPIALLDGIRDLMALQTGQTPNKLVLGVDVYRVLKNHAAFIERIKYSQKAVVTTDLMAQFFEVEEVLVARSIYNAKDETNVVGAPGTEGGLSMQWIVDSKSMLLIYAPANVGLNMPTAGLTFAWTNLIAGAGNANGGVIERYREGPNHSDIFQIRDAWDQGIVASDLGVFFHNAVA
jgi:hypothetical protein